MSSSDDASAAPASTDSVSVIGLGAMGRALAAAFLTAGHRTTVWNRTAGRAGDLVGKGAIEAATVAEAVSASSLTVVCVLDRDAVEAVFDAAGDGLAGASVVNLTSSTPADARALAALAEKADVRYLDGKIMVPTSLVGTGHGHYLYAGDAALFEEHAATLSALGGEADLLGEDHGLAALYDLAMLDVFFNGMTAFLHAAALVGAEGVSATRFLDYARRVTSVLDLSMAGLAADVDQGEHPGHEDNLVMDGAALGHIVEASAAAGIDTSVPALPRELAVAAIGRGYGADGWSRVVDLLRRPAH